MPGTTLTQKTARFESKSGSKNRMWTRALGIILLVAFLPACHKTANVETATSVELSGKISTNATTGQIKAAADMVQSGALDDAAARLIQIRASASSFTPQQAAQYRQTMAEAYSRALEAAQKGDPRAQAAVQLLRVAGPK
jgi:hypothetical protein